MALMTRLRSSETCIFLRTMGDEGCELEDRGDGAEYSMLVVQSKVAGSEKCC